MTPDTQATVAKLEGLLARVQHNRGLPRARLAAAPVAAVEVSEAAVDEAAVDDVDVEVDELLGAPEPEDAGREMLESISDVDILEEEIVELDDETEIETIEGDEEEREAHASFDDDLANEVTVQTEIELPRAAAAIEEDDIDVEVDLSGEADGEAPVEDEPEEAAPDESAPISSRRPKPASSMDEALAGAAEELGGEEFDLDGTTAQPPLHTPPPESGQQPAADDDADAFELESGKMRVADAEPAAGPTMEQLGETVELEEGPEAEFELGAAPEVSPSQRPSPDESELDLPPNQFHGAYDDSLAPPPEAAQELEEHARSGEAPAESGPIQALPSDPAASEPPVVAPPVVESAQQAPAPVAPPVVEAPLQAPAPAAPPVVQQQGERAAPELTGAAEDLSGPDATRRRPVEGRPAEFTGELPRFEPRSFAELLDASLELTC